MVYTPPTGKGAGTTGRVNRPSAVKAGGAAKPATSIAKPLAKPAPAIKSSVVGKAKIPKPPGPGGPMRKPGKPGTGGMKRTF
jgi:hypothetical protein